MGMKASSGTTLLLVLALAGCSTATVAPAKPMEPTTAGQGTLVVEIAGLRNAVGRVSVSIFDGTEGFPQDTTAASRSASVELIRGDEVVLHFEDLDYGNYAVAVLHDENGNGLMDTALFGIPSEGFAFSNNPRPGFGAPSFEACKFPLNQAQVTLRLEMRYF